MLELVRRQPVKAFMGRSDDTKNMRPSLTVHLVDIPARLLLMSPYSPILEKCIRFPFHIGKRDDINHIKKCWASSPAHPHVSFFTEKRNKKKAKTGLVMKPVGNRHGLRNDHLPQR